MGTGGVDIEHSDGVEQCLWSPRISWCHPWFAEGSETRDLVDARALRE